MFSIINTDMDYTVIKDTDIIKKWYITIHRSITEFVIYKQDYTIRSFNFVRNNDTPMLHAFSCLNIHCMRDLLLNDINATIYNDQYEIYVSLVKEPVDVSITVDVYEYLYIAFLRTIRAEDIPGEVNKIILHITSNETTNTVTIRYVVHWVSDHISPLVVTVESSKKQLFRNTLFKKSYSNTHSNSSNNHISNSKSESNKLSLSSASASASASAMQ
jgi:hypothetical protein